MRNCPQCGTPHLPNAIFCETCAAALHVQWDSGQLPAGGTAPQSGPLRALAMEIIGSGRCVEVQITEGPVTLGRLDRQSGQAPGLDLTEDGAGEMGVSRLHARLLLRGDQVMVEDLHSANGTWVNQVQLSPNRPFPLQHGDVLRLDKFGMRVNLIR